MAGHGGTRIWHPYSTYGHGKGLYYRFKTGRQVHETGRHGLQLKEVAEIQKRNLEKRGGSPPGVFRDPKSGKRGHFKPLQNYFRASSDPVSQLKKPLRWA